MDGWIKLHRKLLNNSALFRAGSTFPLLCLLLLMANKEGKVVTGRDFLARKLRIKPSTIYKALNKLRSVNVIDMKSDNKGTVIAILNWSKYQQQSNSKVTTKEQQSNTSIRIENKNIEKEIYKEKENTLAYLQELPLEDIDQFQKTYHCSVNHVKEMGQKIFFYCQSKGRTYKNYRAALQKWLLQEYGYRKVPVQAKVNVDDYEFDGKTNTVRLKTQT